MPANLNALIRYKAIDRCLSNRFSPCNIGQLQEICSEALGEFRGVYKKVSERTIRDDIRVMRSEMLGFNAPIVCKDGLYSYSDPNYSIFAVSIRDMALLKQVMQILLDNRMRLREKGVDDVIRELGMLIADISYTQYSQQPMKHSKASGSPLFDLNDEESDTEVPVSESRIESSESSRFSKIIKRIRLRKKIKEDYGDRHFLPSLGEEDTIHFSISPIKTSFGWGEVLNLVG
jgi:hypothetical protein